MTWSLPPERSLKEEMPRTLVIACGALAREVLSLVKAANWTHIDVTCLPANLHNQPQYLPERLRQRIQELRSSYDQIQVLYGDCGSGGQIDAMLAEEGVERIPGPHCYAVYAGAEFTELMEEEPGSFFLTDYLVRHFESLIIQGLGLDRHPELRDSYFQNYRRLVYLAQTEDASLQEMARRAAKTLDLAYHYRFTGLGSLKEFLSKSRQNGGTNGRTDRDD